MQAFHRGQLYVDAEPISVEACAGQQHRRGVRNRFEVDVANKTLIDKPTLVGQTFTSDFAGYQASSLAFERSVQIGPNIYYLSSPGVMTSSLWQ